LIDNRINGGIVVLPLRTSNANDSTKPPRTKSTTGRILTQTIFENISEYFFYRRTARQNIDYSPSSQTN